MDQTTNEVRLANWKAIIEDCQRRPEGQTAKQWMNENGISEKQYYYWLRKFRTAAYKQATSALLPPEEKQPTSVTFAEIPAREIMSCPEPTSVMIKTKKSTIEIPTNIPESLMVRIIKAVSHAL